MGKTWRLQARGRNGRVAWDSLDGSESVRLRSLMVRRERDEVRAENREIRETVGVTVS